jgi:2-oxoglutarate dehydrogenase E2 component (dihydrolipoamide succinyltransferase)
MKKGYQSGKAFVGDDPDPNKGQPGYDGGGAAPTGGAPAAAPTGGAPAAAAPAAEPAASSTTPPSAQDINAQGPAGTAPAKPQTGAAGQALAKTTAVVDKQQAQSQEKANQTVYAQVKANVDKLDKKGKQRILQLLQKSVAAPAPKPAAGAAAKPGASPAAGGTGSGFNPDTGKPFASDAERAAYDASPAAKMPTADVEKAAGGAAAPAPAAPAPAAPANTMANAPVSATNTAAADNPNQPPPKKTGGKVAGQVSQTPGAIAKREKRQAAAAAKSTGNRVMGNMVNTLQQQNASKVNYGNALSEALAQRVEMHKQKMFETGLSQGTISVFRK